MKIKHLLAVLVVAASSSCSTAYRTGQTPDDVYYSPAPEQSSYVSSVTDQDKNSYSYRNNEESDIRRGIENPVYRNTITFSMGMGYGYNPYSLYPYNSFSNPFYGYDPYSPYSPYAYSPYGLKGMYDPYYSPFGYNDLSFYNNPYGYGYSPYYNYYSPVFYSHNVNTNTGPRKYNLNAYTNTSRNSGARGNVQPIRTNPTGTIQPSGSGIGKVIRRVFTPSENRTYTTPNSNRTYNSNNTRTYNSNRSNTYQTPTRTFERSTPSESTPSSSSSGNTNSSAPVRTFRR